MLFTLTTQLQRTDQTEAHVHTYAKYVSKCFRLQVEEDHDIFFLLQRISHSSNFTRKTKVTVRRNNFCRK